MNGRGWTAEGLKTVGEDDHRLWTVAEAACHLHLTVSVVRSMIVGLGLQPVGKRQAGYGHPGRQPRVYRAIDFIQAHEARSKFTKD